MLRQNLSFVPKPRLNVVELPIGQFLTPRCVIRSQAMIELAKEIGLYASLDGHVLLLGETGTGKELLAEAIHYLGDRSLRPFCPVNCAHLTDDLFVSIMFGHEKGSFTGAHERKIGEVEAAEGGTLFLDEISELKPSAQAQLLRFLETRKFKRLGNTREQNADVRIVAASNLDLWDQVKQGKFRDDLLNRLDVFTCVVPPLRERLDDILPILRFLILRHMAEHNISKVEFASSCFDELNAYQWPGNVRELSNVVYRTIVRNPDGIVPKMAWSQRFNKENPAGSQLASTSPASNESLNLRENLKDMERRTILEVLKRTGGNAHRTSELLGISRNNLYQRMDRLNISRQFQ